MSSPVTVEVQGVKGLAGSVKLVYRDGLTVHVGPNGVGKTSAIDASAAAAGAKVQLVRSDSARGDSYVRSGGMVIEIGGRVSRSGAPSFSVAEYWGLADILDPQGKSRNTRDKNRREALRNFIDVRADRALVRRLASAVDHEDLPPSVSRWLLHGERKPARSAAATAYLKVFGHTAEGALGRDDILEDIKLRMEHAAEVAGAVEIGPDATLYGLAPLVKRQADTLARTWEKDRDARLADERAVGEQIEEKLDDLEGFEVPERSSDVLEEAVDAQAKKLGVLEVELEKRKALEEQRQVVGDTDASALEREAVKLRAELKGLVADVREKGARLAALEGWKLVFHMEEDREDPTVVGLVDRAKSLAKLEQLASEDDVDREREELDRLKGRHAAALMHEAVAQLQVVERRHADAAEEMDVKAHAFRSIAGEVADRVVEIMGEQKLGGITVQPDGAVWAPDSVGNLRHIEDLSLGEKVRVVFGGVGMSRSESGLMPIEFQWLWSLQPSEMRKLVGECLKLSIKLVSEWPVDGNRREMATVYLDRAWIDSGESGVAYIERALAERPEGVVEVHDVGRRRRPREVGR